MMLTQHWDQGLALISILHVHCGYFELGLSYTV